MGQGLTVLGVLCSEYRLPILSVGEYPFAFAQAVGNVPSGVALHSALEGVGVVGSENLARSEIKSCVCHSNCLSFVLSVTIIPQSQANVNSFGKNNLRQITQTFGGKIAETVQIAQTRRAHNRERAAERKAKGRVFHSPLKPILTPPNSRLKIAIIPTDHQNLRAAQPSQGTITAFHNIVSSQASRAKMAQAITVARRMRAT